MSTSVDAMLHKLSKTEVLNITQAEEVGNGTPLFTEEDVTKSINMLSVLLRAICVREHITIQELSQKQREYLAGEEIDPASFSTAKTNLIAALARPAVSFNKFYDTLCGILGYNMDISVTLSKNGKSQVYTYSTLVPEMVVFKRANKVNSLKHVIEREGGMTIDHGVVDED